ncbi:cache domain-containing sensor histidine kinase [Carnobacterium sp.]|uniref:cache domain-containing sensor histidine kinase n=1 Tax=Carnobacterium sp. TaxID=48221 RepID=UPI003C78B4DE
MLNSLKRIGIQWSKKIKSLQVILALSLSVLTIVTILLFSIFLSVIFKDTLVNHSKITTLQSVKQSSISLTNEIETMNGTAYGILDELKRTELQVNQISELLGTSFRLNRNVVSVSLLDQKGKITHYAPSQYTPKEMETVFNQRWFQNESERITVSSPHVQNLFEKNHQWVLSMTTPVTIQSKQYTLLIDYNFNSLGSYFNKVTIGKRGYSFILDDKNELIYHPKQRIIQTNAKEENLTFVKDKSDGVYITEDQKNTIAVATIPSTGWKIIGVSYLTDSLNEAIVDIKKNTLWIFLIVFSLILVMSISVSKYIAHPITNMVKVMKNVNENKFDVYTHENRFTEIQQLSGSYNHLIDQVKELMVQVKDEQEGLRKSEMNVLQAQINPHFLYNTLESILWMSERGNNKGASEMVAALGKLLRISLNKGNHMIPISQELAHAQSYLTIQQIRYKNQFHYTIEADESILVNPTIKIIIQPFLENALYHGIERMIDEGNISIKAMDKKNKILIEIKDDGIGMSLEAIQEIEKGMDSKKGGIGIRNVHQRIQMYFGKEYGVEIKSELDLGTTINIWLPKA